MELKPFGLGMSSAQLVLEILNVSNIPYRYPVFLIGSHCIAYLKSLRDSWKEWAIRLCAAAAAT